MDALAVAVMLLFFFPEDEEEEEEEHELYTAPSDDAEAAGASGKALRMVAGDARLATSP